MDIKRMQELGGVQHQEIDDIPTQAIDLIDDMLASLPEQERYSTKGDVLRYILQKLQG